MLFPVVNSVETIFLLKHCYEEFLSIYYLLHSIQEYLFAFSKPLQIGPLHYNNLVFLYTYRHLYRLRQIEIFFIITAAIHIHVLVQTLADFPYTDVPFYPLPPPVLPYCTRIKIWRASLLYKHCCCCTIWHISQLTHALWNHLDTIDYIPVLREMFITIVLDYWAL
jgi:hypothetical protein